MQYQFSCLISLSKYLFFSNGKSTFLMQLCMKVQSLHAWSYHNISWWITAQYTGSVLRVLSCCVVACRVHWSQGVRFCGSLAGKVHVRVCVLPCHRAESGTNEVQMSGGWKHQGAGGAAGSVISLQIVSKSGEHSVPIKAHPQVTRTLLDLFFFLLFSVLCNLQNTTGVILLILPNLFPQL